jgi:hypothetical protein
MQTGTKIVAHFQVMLGVGSSELTRRELVASLSSRNVGTHIHNNVIGCGKLTPFFVRIVPYEKGGYLAAPFYNNLKDHNVKS